MTSIIKSFLKNGMREASRIAFQEFFNNRMQRRFDTIILERWERKARSSKNPLVQCGAKYYSQNDEDGILLEILGRIGIDHGSFVEIGVGNGLENNTIILLMHGWRGLWVGNEKLVFKTEDSTRLRYQKQLVTIDNAGASINNGLNALGLNCKSLDVLSIDIDSFDYHVVTQLLKNEIKPRIIIVEYNAKFPPPIRFSLLPHETWDGSDYSGCSLQSWCDLLGPNGYQLVACNVTGVNAFFVESSSATYFQDVPTDIRSLFMPPDYNWFIQSGHPPSPKTIRRFIADLGQR